MAYSMVVYFYPRSPCGERRVTVLGVQHRTGISIHALLAESDAPGTSVFRGWTLFLSTLSLRRATWRALQPKPDIPISIHALLAESDVNEDRYGQQYWRFLSTLSLRRATKIPNQRKIDQKNFYPRSPCGERHKISAVHITRENFYPRSPCGERL